MLVYVLICAVFFLKTLESKLLESFIRLGGINFDYNFFFLCFLLWSLEHGFVITTGFIKRGLTIVGALTTWVVTRDVIQTCMIRGLAWKALQRGVRKGDVIAGLTILADGTMSQSSWPSQSVAMAKRGLKGPYLSMFQTWLRWSWGYILFQLFYKDFVLFSQNCVIYDLWLLLTCLWESPHLWTKKAFSPCDML